jgi:endonuclease YncB( thermonuclease family)
VKVCLALVVLAAATVPVAARSVTNGDAAARHKCEFICDGDTLKLNGVTYRLWGIDAPETKQLCGDYAAGIMATETLEMLVRGKTVVCEPKTTDRYGRTVAVCRADGEDLGRTMVQLGMAWAFVRYSHDYVDVETQAKAENLGVHGWKCEPAWDWRAHQRQ